MQSPQLQIYNAVFMKSLGLKYPTYDYLPPSSASLPFVYVGEQFDQDRQTKDVIFGDVQQTVHVYGSYKQRRQVTDMMNSLKAEIRTINKTSNFYVTVKGISTQTMIDDSTSETLLHGIIEVDFTFN